MLRGNLFSGIFIVLFLTMAIGMAAVDILASRKEGQASEIQQIIDGRWTSAYEQIFNVNLYAYQPSVDIWGVLNYALFNNGKEGVIVGEDGWLFTSEEFDFYPDAEKQMEQKLDYILYVNDMMSRRGIRLMVALVPAKARIYKGKLGRYDFPSYKQNDYFQFVSELVTEGIPVIDLSSAFAASQDKNPVFLKTDTHWSPFGAKVAANAIAEKVEASFPDLLKPKKEYSNKLLQTIEHEGDLLRYLPLGRMSEVIGPEADSLPEYEVINSDPASSKGPDLEAALFDETEIPVALVGTSYSANDNWNFEGFLKEALCVDVLNAADEGKGPFLTMADFMKNDAFKNNPPGLVIWEIPERYLPVEYELALIKSERDDA